jgi:putative heme-binding domain-containing protein
VRLVKTPNGYVGQETLIACLAMLTTDVTLSPKGDLYLCCHSGAPDWGEGPRGEGKIFKITYTDPNAPQPIAAWPSGPNEVRVAFDRPVDPVIAGEPGKIRIEAGEFVTAGDRFEILKPPYKTVFQQEGAPRRNIAVSRVTLFDQGQTLVLETSDSVQVAEQYGLTIPVIRRPNGTAGAIVDLSFNNCGAEMRAKKMPPEWIPTPDLAIARRIILPGKELRTRREGDFETDIRFQLPPDDLTIEMVSSETFEVSCDGQSLGVKKDVDRYVTRFRFEDRAFGAVTPKDRNSERVSVFGIEKGGTLVPPVPPLSQLFGMAHFVVIRSKTAYQFEPIHLTYTRPGDPTPRPLTPSMTLIPGARMITPTAPDIKNASKPREPISGNAAHGRELFFGDRLKCATCHRIFGEGSLVGPDLSNLHERDAASVLRDITDPNASINPGYVAYQILRSDGETVLGLFRGATAEVIQLAGADGKMIDVPRSEIKEMRPSLTSLMPAGLLDGLPTVDRDDLLRFLLTAPAKAGK